MATFTWGPGGAQMTPEQIAAQRMVSQALMQQGMDYSPVKHWTQGAARVSQALLGGFEGYRADEAEKVNRVADQELQAKLLGGLGGTPAVAPAAPMVAPDAPAVSPPAITPEAAPALTSSIAKVAAARGIDPAYLTRTAMLESGGNINAANPNSSARGPFQFLKSTAQQYGLANPNDPDAATDAAARLALDNKATLTKALGREPTSAELYLAHQQGGGGASKLLANPDAPVETIIGPEAARLNGATPGMTAGQFAAKWTNKFGGAPAAAPGAMAEGGAPAVAPAQTPTSGLAGVNPALIQALTSPYSSPATKKIAEIMLAQQTKRDPLDIEAKQLDIATKRKGLEAPPTVQRVKQPDGSEVALQWDTKTKTWMPLEAPKGGNPVSTPKLTEQQSKDVGFYNRGEKLLPRLETQDQALTEFGSATGSKVSNYFKSDAYRQAEQTGRELLAVILRKDTGAAVTPQEFEMYGSVYLPRPGDDAATIDQKRVARKTAIEGLRMGLGPAEIIFKSREAADAARPQTATPAPAAPVVTGKTKAGVTWSVK